MRSPSKIAVVMAAVLILTVTAVTAVAADMATDGTQMVYAIAVLALVPAMIIPIVILKIRNTVEPPEQLAADLGEYLMPLEEEKEEIIGKEPPSFQ